MSSTAIRTPELAAAPRVRAQAAHLVGICGSGMKALAELLAGQGWKISGSDMQLTGETPLALAQRGLQLHQGHRCEFLPEDAELLVYSPAIGPHNPERIAAAERGIPQRSYTQMLGDLMRTRTGLSIAGTHGKSTTTAMTGSILTDAAYDPSVIVGAEVRGRHSNGWGGHGEFFVAESCEFQRGFLDLNPRYAAILGIETDHFDCFRDLDETIAAFAEFAARLPSSGGLIVRDEAASIQAARSATVPFETFSLNPTSDWWASGLRPTQQGTQFQIFHHGQEFAEIDLQIPGDHNVLNAIAAAALCSIAGASANEIRLGLNAFTGIKRRLECVGTWSGVTIIDDYAHHPTAVRASLETVRRHYPGRRIVCVFQPHQVSRTQALMADFATSFRVADQVVIVPVFAAREKVSHEPTETARELVSRITAAGLPARFCSALDQSISTLEDGLRPGDVLITMGAGDIGQLHHAFTQRLQRNYPPR